MRSLRQRFSSKYSNAEPSRDEQVKPRVDERIADRRKKEKWLKCKAFAHTGDDLPGYKFVSHKSCEFVAVFGWYLLSVAANSITRARC